MYLENYSFNVKDIPAKELFLETEIPSIHPLSPFYKEYWKEQYRRCIEGHWVSGKWMSGKLYFYVNFATIKKNVGGSKVKQLGRPDLRDLEWMLFLNWEESRGFSGFSNDDVYSCNDILAKIPSDMSKEDIIKFYCNNGNDEFGQAKIKNLFTSEGNLKTYISPREYLRTTYAKNMGSPLYFNQAHNFMMLGSRGYGKSYSLAGIVAHEFLFNGKTSVYDKALLSAEILVAAYDSKYSADTLSKVEMILNNLPGEFSGLDRYGKDKTYPPPFFRNYKGSWDKQITAAYRKKVGGQWVWAGSKTNIKNRTFRDNPYAAQGTRPGVILWEEVGMFNNFLESYNASVETQRDGAVKFGTMMFIGTGGAFETGGTVDAHEMFYNPEKYDLIYADDIWEHKGKIAYFVPAYLGLNQFKNENNITDIESAYKFLENEREILRNQKGNSSALFNELQYRPLKPSEIFLASSGNIFPTAELQDRLNELEQSNSFELLEKKVSLYFDKNQKYGVNYKIDVENKLTAINEFPWKGEGKESREGAVLIYEFPQTDINGNIPPDLYVIGHDPYGNDNDTGGSLGAIYVLKTKAGWKNYGHDEVVASYVGRPFAGRHVVNDILMKLSMMYGNAKIFFENVRGNVKEYFEKHKRLDLLAKRPQTLFNKKAAYNTAAPVEYGYPMSSKSAKLDSILYIRDWLLETRISNSEGNTTRNLNRLWDKALIQEMIAFDLDGNYDRVMAFVGCILGINEMHNQYENEVINAGRMMTTSTDMSFLADNPKLFSNSFKSKIEFHTDWNSLL